MHVISCTPFRCLDYAVLREHQIRRNQRRDLTPYTPSSQADYLHNYVHSSVRFVKTRGHSSYEVSS